MPSNLHNLSWQKGRHTSSRFQAKFKKEITYFAGNNWLSIIRLLYCWMMALTLRSILI